MKDDGELKYKENRSDDLELRNKESHSGHLEPLDKDNCKDNSNLKDKKKRSEIFGDPKTVGKCTHFEVVTSKRALREGYFREGASRRVL